MKRATTAAEVNALLSEAASHPPLDGILGVEKLALVGADYKDNPRSAVIDAPSTLVIDGTQVKILAWYDHEWGYACRMVELAKLYGVMEPVTVCCMLMKECVADESAAYCSCSSARNIAKLREDPG